MHAVHAAKEVKNEWWCVCLYVWGGENSTVRDCWLPWSLLTRHFLDTPYHLSIFFLSIEGSVQTCQPPGMLVVSNMARPMR